MIKSIFSLNIILVAYEAGNSLLLVKKSKNFNYAVYKLLNFPNKKILRVESNFFRKLGFGD